METKSTRSRLFRGFGLRAQMLRVHSFLFTWPAVGSQNFVQFLHKVADHDGLGQKAVHAAF